MIFLLKKSVSAPADCNCVLYRGLGTTSFYACRRVISKQAAAMPRLTFFTKPFRSCTGKVGAWINEVGWQGSRQSCRLNPIPSLLHINHPRPSLPTAQTTSGLDLLVLLLPGPSAP